MVGPAAPIIGRIRSLYLMELLLKLPKKKGMGLRYKVVIRNHINFMLSEKDYKSVHVVVDVDPI